MSGPTAGLAPPATEHPPRRVFVLGATGTIGQATVRELLHRGHEVVCFVRPRAGVGGALEPAQWAQRLPGAEWRVGEVQDAASLRQQGLRGERFDVLLSCLASRTGVPADAWAIDHRAHVQALAAARDAGVTQVVQLSALCVQKPRLAFQQAKLAYERELRASGLRWSIVRPTAFFKSLSGQVARLQQGKPFLVFGDGRLTACKPIGDEDLAAYLCDCLHDPTKADRVLPIGGPGPAMTPREQGEALFRLLGRPPRFKQVPPGLLLGIATGLGWLGHMWPAAAAKGELARIGHYYATESMLVWDAERGCYDAEATPSTGTQTLIDYQAQLLSGQVVLERGDHAVF